MPLHGGTDYPYGARPGSGTYLQRNYGGGGGGGYFGGGHGAYNSGGGGGSSFIEANASSSVRIAGELTTSPSRASDFKRPAAVDHAAYPGADLGDISHRSDTDVTDPNDVSGKIGYGGRKNTWGYCQRGGGNGYIKIVFHT